MLYGEKNRFSSPELPAEPTSARYRSKANPEFPLTRVANSSSVTAVDTSRGFWESDARANVGDGVADGGGVAVGVWPGGVAVTADGSAVGRSGPWVEGTAERPGSGVTWSTPSSTLAADCGVGLTGTGILVSPGVVPSGVGATFGVAVAGPDTAAGVKVGFESQANSPAANRRPKDKRKSSLFNNESPRVPCCGLRASRGH